MLFRKFQPTCLLAIGLLGVGTPLLAGYFVAPAEGPVAFRRDKMPLDADMMATLARQLVMLTQGLDTETPERQRAATQMLALAIALDPGNARARATLGDFEKDQPPPLPEPVQIERSQTQVWQLRDWLASLAAGSPGQALAACLTDVMVVTDPQHPQAEELRAKGERGAWRGWVPELAAYQHPSKPSTPLPDDVVTKDPEPPKSALRLAKARVFVPLWRKDRDGDDGKWVQTPAPLVMTAETIPAEDGEKLPFSLIFGPDAADGCALPALSEIILHILEKQYGKLPAGCRVKLTSDEFKASLRSGKRHSISAAAAVLAGSAISGIEPDATIIGILDEAGNFKLPSGFWDQLLALAPGKGGRLVLPAAAADYLPSLLAFEKPQTFFGYEVLLAANFKELLNLSAKKPVDPVGSIVARFQEIREKGASQPLGPYIANSFVRRRLADLAQDAPYHFSAKMLALQGAGNRPVFIPRVVLIPELRRAIEPMDWLIKFEGLVSNQGELKKLPHTYDTCHAQVDRLVRYTEKNDRELVAHVQDMITTIRSLDRAVRTRGESYVTEGAIYNAYTAMTRAHARLVEELAIALSEAEKKPTH